MYYIPPANVLHVWMEYCDGGDLRSVRVIAVTVHVITILTIECIVFTYELLWD